MYLNFLVDFCGILAKLVLSNAQNILNVLFYSIINIWVRTTVVWSVDEQNAITVVLKIVNIFNKGYISIYWRRNKIPETQTQGLMLARHAWGEIKYHFPEKK